MLSGWSTGNALESLNQISLTLEPEGYAPSDYLYASLSITTVSADQTSEILNKDGAFKIRNYIGRKLQISIALEEDTSGKTALTVRGGEEDEGILYDSSEAGWGDQDMELFDMLRREVNAETLADLQYVPEFKVYQADFKESPSITQSIRIYNQDIAKWQTLHSDNIVVEQVKSQ